MERLREHVVEPERKKVECFAKGPSFYQSDEGRAAPRADARRYLPSVLDRSDQEPFDDGNVGVVNRFKPFGKFRWINC